MFLGSWGKNFQKCSIFYYANFSELKMMMAPIYSLHKMIPMAAHQKKPK
jgi:hypothetical protein